MQVYFIVSSGALLKQLERIKGGIGSNPALPIIENVLFELSGSNLDLTTTDLNIRLSTSVEVEATSSSVELCIPGRRLLEVLRNLADQPLTFSFDLTTYAVEIKGTSGKYRLAGEDARGFPRPPEFEEITEHRMTAGRLQRALTKSVDFAKTDDLRPPMNGVHIRLTDKSLEFTGSEGHGVIARYRQAYESEKRPTVAAATVVAKSLKLLVGLLPKQPGPVAHVTLCRKHLLVALSHPDDSDFEALLFSCRLLDEQYPDVSSAFVKTTKENTGKLVVGKDELLDSLRRLQGFVDSKTQGVAFELGSDGARLTACDFDHTNEANDFVGGTYGGEPMTVGLRLSNLLTAVGHLDGERVSLAFGASPHHPALLTPATGNEGEQLQIVLGTVAV